jgi:hypothetical protein
MQNTACPRPVPLTTSKIQSIDFYAGGGSKIYAFWRTWTYDQRPDDSLGELRRCDEDYVRTCEEWKNALPPSIPYSVDVSSKDFFIKDADSSSRFSSCTSLFNSRFFMTADGFIGLADESVMPEEDVVYVLIGGNQPFVLRPVKNEPDHYKLICECYVHGIMDGDALTEKYGSFRRRREQCPMHITAVDSGDPHGIWQDVSQV